MDDGQIAGGELVARRLRMLIGSSRDGNAETLFGRGAITNDRFGGRQRARPATCRQMAASERIAESTDAVSMPRVHLFNVVARAEQLNTANAGGSLRSTPTTRLSALKHPLETVKQNFLPSTLTPTLSHSERQFP